MDFRRRQHLIVRIKDRRLVLDKRRLEETLRGLNGDGSSPRKCDILSVVGQRRSGKSTLAQNILKYIRSQFDFDADPWSSERGGQERGGQESGGGGDYGDWEEAGIFFEFLSVQNKRHWLILMDVVSGLETDSSIYTRLIDFCLLTSNFVFYIEDLNQTPVATGTGTESGTSWDLARSTFYKRLDGHCRMSSYTNPRAFILLRGTGLVDIGGGVFSTTGRDQFENRKFIQNLASPSFFLSCVLPQYQAKSSGSTQNSDGLMTYFEDFMKRSVFYLDLSRSVVEDVPQTQTQASGTSSKEKCVQSASSFLENSVTILEGWTEDGDLIDFKVEMTDDEEDETQNSGVTKEGQPFPLQEAINHPAEYTPTHQSTSSNTSNGNGVSDAQFYNPAGDSQNSFEPASGPGQEKIAEPQLIGFEPLEKGIQCAESSPSQQSGNKDPAKNISPTLISASTQQHPNPTNPLNAAPTLARQEDQEFDFQAAASTAIQKCVTFIKHRMENKIFTDLQIRHLHRDAYHCVTSDGVCSQLSTRNKELYLSQVNKILSERKKICIIQNEQEIKGRVKGRQRVLQETSQFFEKLLQEYLTTVGPNPNPKYREFTATAQELAARMYVEKCDKESLDHTNWFNLVNLELQERQGSVERGVGKLKEGDTYPLEHHEFLTRLKNVQDTVAPSPVHLAFHLSPTSLGAATSQGSTFRPKNMDWPLLISFEGNKTLIGKEAQGSSSKNAMDLYRMLRKPERSPFIVLVKKDHVELHIEEILSMFLFKVRREIESEFRVHIDSCVMVTSPFLSITAKQRLKTALFLAGFKDTTLIQSHTAVALGFHYLGREAATAKATPVRSLLLTLRETPERLEVAVLRLSESGVAVQATGVTTTTATDQKTTSYKKLIITTVNNSKISHQDVPKLIPVIIKSAGGNVSVNQKGETQLARVIRKEKELKPINWSGGKTVDELSWILSSALHFKMFQFQSSTQIAEVSTSSLFLSVRTSANIPLPQKKDIQLLSPNQGLLQGLTWTIHFPKLSPGTVFALREGNWRGEERLVGYIETDCAISSQVHISPEGLFQIVNPSNVLGKIQFASHYLTPEKVTLSKDKLATKYFKDKNYFDESWTLFQRSLESFRRTRHDDEPRFSSGKDSTSSDAVATYKNNVQKAKEKLREYMTKVEQSLSQTADGGLIISDRIREKVKQDLEQCVNFLANAPQDSQIKDVERQLTRLQISTRPLKLL